jgi:hypothetical protein
VIPAIYRPESPFKAKFVVSDRKSAPYRRA